MKLAIEELKGLDEDMLDLTGFDKDLIIEPDEKDDEVPDVPDEPKSKLGDLYELGNHRVLCGDSTKIEDVEKLMDGKKADMVFTDPPYGMFLQTDFSKIKGSSKSIGFKGKLLGNKYDAVIGDKEDFTPALITTIFDNFGYCKEKFIFGADYFIDLLPNFGKDGCLLVWNKRSSDEQQKGIGSCFELFFSNLPHKKYVFSFEWFGFLSKDAPQEARNRVHPTMKPIGLIEKIWLWFKSPSGIVVDLYLGSGSTLVASEKTGRICYGMELSEHYTDVIVERYCQYTGNRNIKLNGEEIIWQDQQKTTLKENKNAQN
jgi:DNA modification methylase